MAHLKRLVHEIHRRSLWQVLGIYPAGPWLALQVVETLSQTVGLPGIQTDVPDPTRSGADSKEG